MFAIKSFLTWAAVAIVAASTALHAAELSVFAAVSLKAALTEMGSGYERESGDKIVKTDALISKKVKVAVEISATEGPKISYPLAVVKESKQPEIAKRFARHLASSAARAVFEKFGFGVVK